MRFVAGDIILWNDLHFWSNLYNRIETEPRCAGGETRAEGRCNAIRRYEAIRRYNATCRAISPARRGVPSPGGFSLRRNAAAEIGKTENHRKKQRLPWLRAGDRTHLHTLAHMHILTCTPNIAHSNMHTPKGGTYEETSFEPVFGVCPLPDAAADGGVC